MVYLPWDRFYDLKNIFAKKIGEKLAFFAQTTASFLKKKLIITSVFEKYANFFRRKL
jgi:hypothetical protein